MSKTPCISWPWICTWCCKQPMVSRQPREDTAHGSTSQETGLGCLACHAETLEEISALNAQQLVYLLLHSRLPSSPTQQQREAGCLSRRWAGQQCFPPTLEPSTATVGAAASLPGVVASLAWLLGGLEPGNGSFCLLPDFPSPAGTSFASWLGSMLEDIPVPKAKGVLHWIW